MECLDPPMPKLQITDRAGPCSASRQHVRHLRCTAYVARGGSSSLRHPRSSATPPSLKGAVRSLIPSIRAPASK